MDSINLSSVRFSPLQRMCSGDQLMTREALTPHTCCQAGPAVTNVRSLCLLRPSFVSESGLGGLHHSHSSHLSAHTTRIPTGKVKVGSLAVKYLIRPPDKYRMRYVTHSLLQNFSHHFCDEYSDHRKYLSRLLRDTGQRPDDRRDSSHNIFSHNYTFPDP